MYGFLVYLYSNEKTPQRRDLSYTTSYGRLSLGLHDNVYRDTSRQVQADPDLSSFRRDEATLSITSPLIRREITRTAHNQKLPWILKLALLWTPSRQTLLRPMTTTPNRRRRVPRCSPVTRTLHLPLHLVLSMESPLTVDFASLAFNWISLIV